MVTLCHPGPIYMYISSPNDLYCVEWDVKPYSTQLQSTYLFSDIRALSPERQSARMSTTDNVGNHLKTLPFKVLTRNGHGYH